jgi:hydrogenase maturation protein HypF
LLNQGTNVKQRVKVVIHGAVQGVGFRPFVYRLAADLKLNGWIINSSQGVFIEAEGTPVTLHEFLTRLKTDKPRNSFIQSFEHSFLDPVGFENFEIRESNEAGAKTALVLPDIATCFDCLEEIFNPDDRRYLYPFTNCTNCGPRFSIITSLPYDRTNTSMGEFEMCEKCRSEYENPLNRRFHAEPTACPVCGPIVYLTDNKGKPLYKEQEAVLNAVSVIKEGKIVALKGIGGYQLICDASNDAAVKTLRARKRRSEKPFALMFPNIDSVKDICDVSKEEETLLLSNEAPIVLLRKQSNADKVVSKEAVINNPFLGVMLPYSPLHHILMLELEIPVIATSGNISEEPICINEETALLKLADIADFFLSHNRKIIRHIDDSIARIIIGREMLMRRARGYAPLPVKIKGLDKPLLAVGGHLKNTIAVNKNDNVFISQHIGDLENIESITAFKNVINDLESFYEIKPEQIVCDMHPEYISTKFAGEQSGNVISVQHHFAHVLSCIAENEIEGKVLGFSWDGTGYGTSGSRGEMLQFMKFGGLVHHYFMS